MRQYSASLIAGGHTGRRGIDSRAECRPDGLEEAAQPLSLSVSFVVSSSDEAQLAIRFGFEKTIRPIRTAGWTTKRPREDR